MQNPKHQLVLPEAKSCSQGNPAWRAEPRAAPLYLHSVSRAHTPSRNAQRSNPTSACRRNTRRKADSRPSDQLLRTQFPSWSPPGPLWGLPFGDESRLEDDGFKHPAAWQGALSTPGDIPMLYPRTVFMPLNLSCKDNGTGSNHCPQTTHLSLEND